MASLCLKRLCSIQIFCSCSISLIFKESIWIFPFAHIAQSTGHRSPPFDIAASYHFLNDSCAANVVTFKRGIQFLFRFILDNRQLLTIELIHPFVRFIRTSGLKNRNLRFAEEMENVSRSTINRKNSQKWHGPLSLHPVHFRN